MAHVMNVLPLDDPYIGSIEWGGYVWTNSDVFRDPVTIGYFLSNDVSTWTSIEGNAVAVALQAGQTSPTSPSSRSAAPPMQT